MENILNRWKSKLNNQEFLRPFSVSNLGIIDEAFSFSDGHYPIESFYFTISEQAMPYGLVIFVSTVKEKICLNFSYATPAFNKKTAEDIAAQVFDYLKLNF